MDVRLTSSPSVGRAVASCVAAVEAVAFWTAAVLPFAYLPVVVAVGHGTLAASDLVGVLVANAVALAVGHGYEPGSHRRPEPGDGRSRDTRAGAPLAARSVERGSVDDAAPGDSHSNAD